MLAIKPQERYRFKNVIKNKKSQIFFLARFPPQFFIPSTTILIFSLNFIIFPPQCYYSLLHNFISFPPPPHFYFSSSSSFLLFFLLPLFISIIFPPPPPHFYYFPSSSTSFSFLLFSLEKAREAKIRPSHLSLVL